MKEQFTKADTMFFRAFALFMPSLGGLEDFMIKFELTAVKNGKVEKRTYSAYWQALTAGIQFMNIGWEVNIKEIKL